MSGQNVTVVGPDISGAADLASGMASSQPSKPQGASPHLNPGQFKGLLPEGAAEGAAGAAAGAGEAAAGAGSLSELLPLLLLA